MTRREALLASAEKAIQKGRFESALNDYLKVLEETPNDINILNKAGDVNVRLGRNDESITYFLRIAEFYARDGFYVRSIAMYKKINRLDPARLDIYEKLGTLYVKQQLWAEAKSNYQFLANYLVNADNLQGAIGIYQKMIAIEPGNSQFHYALADLFMQVKRMPEALRELGVVAAEFSEGPKHEAVRQVWQRALDFAPENVEVLEAVVQSLISIGAFPEARKVLETATVLNASSPIPRKLLADVLLAEATSASVVTSRKAVVSPQPLGSAGSAQSVSPGSDGSPALELVPEAGLEEGPQQVALQQGPVPKRELGEVLADADVLRKYGLWNQASVALSPFADAPGEGVTVREYLLDLYSENGQPGLARREAQILAGAYRRDGNETRAAALEGWLLYGEGTLAPRARPDSHGGRVVKRSRVSEVIASAKSSADSWGGPLGPLDEDVFGLGSSPGATTISHEEIVRTVLGNESLLDRVLASTRGEAGLRPSGGVRHDDEVSSRFALRVETEYPTPIAAPWVVYYRSRSTADPGAGTRYLVYVLEGLLRFLAAVGISEARRLHRRVSLPEAQRTQFIHSSPTAGTLECACRGAAEAVGGEGPELLLLLLENAVRKEMTDAVSRRNKAVHEGATADDHRTFAGAVVRILQRMDEQLARAWLFIPDLVRTGEGLDVVESRLFRGALPLPERATFKTDRALRTGVPYIQLPDAEAILPLWPFYRFSRCETEGCGEPHLFEWKGASKRRLKYTALGLLEKHQLEVPGSADEVRGSLDDEWHGPGAVVPERFLWLAEGETDRDVRRKGSALGRFDIVEHLGRGGVADVYAVRDRVSGEERAVKLLSYRITRDRQLLARLRREHGAIRRILHENVVKVDELGEDRGDHFLVEELAPGWIQGTGVARDLSMVAKPVPWQLAVSMIKQVAAGLAAVHAQDIVHRDLKPSNLLLFPPAVVKIADFGVSRSMTDASMTMTGLAIGTPPYMSPEQADAGKVDGRSDLYSLGVILFELLSGQLPFRAENAIQMLMKHRESVPPDLSNLVSDLPAGLSDLVALLLAKRPQQRVPTAQALVNRLREFH